jgi:hypothetical protein
VIGSARMLQRCGVKLQEIGITMATMGQKQTGVAGTTVQLVDVSIEVAKFIKIKALHSNTGRVFLGRDAGVTVTTGYELSSREETELPIEEVSDASALWLVADKANQSVCYRIV